jgi:hypothetical protein
LKREITSWQALLQRLPLSVTSVTSHGETWICLISQPPEKLMFEDMKTNVYIMIFLLMVVLPGLKHKTNPEKPKLSNLGGV